MIKVKDKVVTFSGKDLRELQEYADMLGLSLQDTFTGALWESIMRNARSGAFKRGFKEDCQVEPKQVHIRRDEKNLGLLAGKKGVPSCGMERGKR